MNNSMKKYRTVWPFVFLAPFCLCFLLFNLFPILYSFYMSTLDWAGYNEKVFVGLKNFVNIFTKDKLFWKSVLNTLRIGLVGFPIAIVLGLILAALLSNVKKFKNALQTMNFLPYITTPVAIGMIFTFIFEEHVGILNKLIEFFGGNAVNFVGTAKWAPLVISFMIIWRNTGYFMTMYLAGITSISDELYEAAKIDGASELQCFFKITVPLLKSVTTFLVITSTIYMFQMFDEANLLFTNQSSSTVGGPEQSCLTIVWNFYNQAFGGNPRMGYASAMSCVLFVIIAVVSIIGLRIMNGKGED
ncbi:carbohydrate ABC transporter permease [Ruminococcus sp. 5_1_39BFAA]|uniref:carbohydrate ABC transporter permease n=1 Tax=Ruminococcus sp. 5_1_39BFAA TaxID=457412 RepID=UPI003563F5C7